MDARTERVGEELASGWHRVIDAKRLLSDCQALVRQLEADLRDQLDQSSDLQGVRSGITSSTPR
jgi:regulator of sirC expression with transglutaminase-like and TPR domain